MKIKNDNVLLRDFIITDIEKKCEWINNPKNNRYLHYELPLFVSKTKKWFMEKDNSCRLDLVIEYDNVPVGVIGLLGIDKDKKIAELYITLGETEYKRKGISTKAIEMLIDYSFSYLNLEKIFLNVDAENIVAIGLYEKVGFKLEKNFSQEFFGKVFNRKRYVIDKG